MTADRNGHAWNSVYVNGEYRFIECTWAAGTCGPSGFEKSYVPVPYFLVPPAQFIFSHLPSESPSLQYLPHPLTDTEWLQLIHTGSAFRANGMRLVYCSGMKPTTHNVLSFVEITDDLMELRVEYDTTLRAQTGSQIMGSIEQGVSNRPISARDVIRIPNAPFTSRVKGSGAREQMMIHSIASDSPHKRIYVIKGYLPKGDSVVGIHVQAVTSNPAMHLALGFRVLNHGSGSHYPPPLIYSIDVDLTVVEPIEGILMVGKRVMFRVCGSQPAVVFSPQNQFEGVAMRREGVYQVAEVTVNCVGSWFVGYKLGGGMISYAAKYTVQ
ncbi:hypothetical protein HDU98_006592 [Podochytrium sp. JEL0797]|nr:hypothetical protein HDU98_006592 [Podochytrium sp. JEL0797]